jgi:hypothetical protein
MKKDTHKKRLEKSDIKTILFDALMVYIEPDLMIENRAFTAEYLSNLPQDEYALQMKEYQKSYEIFLDRWPAYVENAASNTKDIAEGYRQMLVDSDAKGMLDIEDALDHFQRDDA